jgi:hypothetical protein
LIANLELLELMGWTTGGVGQTHALIPTLATQFTIAFNADADV